MANVENVQDESFVVGATQSGLAEILEGTLAAHVSGSLTTAEFGRAMVADHTWLQAGLDSAAQQAGIAVPAPSLTPAQIAELQSLLPLSGTTFDAAYLPGEVGDHQATINLFTAETTGGASAALVGTAQAALPILDQHLNAAAILAAVQSGSAIPSFTQPVAVAAPPLAPNGPLNAQDLAFVTSSSQSGLMEISAGQLAEQIAPASFIKGFGDWMVTDHAALNANVSALASAEGVAAPTSPNPDQLQMLATLQTLSGTSFDQQYMTGEVQGHLQTLASFQQEIQAGSDPALVAAAKQGLPLIQAHLAAAVTLDVVVQAGLNDQTAAPSTLAGQFLGVLQDAMNLNTGFAETTANALLTVTTTPQSGAVAAGLKSAIAFLDAAGNVPAIPADRLASAFAGVAQDLAASGDKSLSTIVADMTKLGGLSNSFVSLAGHVSSSGLAQPEAVIHSAGAVLAGALGQVPSVVGAVLSSHHGMAV